MQDSSGVNCDETYPLRSVLIAFCLRCFPSGRSGNLEPSTAPHAPQIVEFQEGVFEEAEETTEEDEKSAEDIAEKSGEALQKAALRALIDSSCAIVKSAARPQFRTAFDPNYYWINCIYSSQLSLFGGVMRDIGSFEECIHNRQ